MSFDLVIDAVETSTPAFCAHHGLRIPAAGSVLSLDDSGPGSGNYAKVYPVLGSGGSGGAIRAKVFSDEGLAELGGLAGVVKAVSRLGRALEDRAGPGWPQAVLAFPFAVIRCQTPTGEAVASLMLDLTALGYQPGPFEPHEAARYRSRPFEERADLALCFVCRYALLEKVGFLHGDLNPENLLVHPSGADVQILDFDSGCVLERGHERPRAAGKPDDCMPPEVKGAGRGAPDVSRLTHAAERWSVGTLVGYLLVGTHPGFFLRAISCKVINDYAACRPGWPEIDENGPLFTRLPGNRLAYRALRDELRSVPGALRELFRGFFAAGLKGGLRPSVTDWIGALTALREPPELERVEVGDTVVLDGENLTLTWKALRATHVEIDSIGARPPTGSLTVVMSCTRSFTVRAVGLYGTEEKTTPIVVVVPRPDLHMVAPAVPGLPYIPSAPGVTTPLPSFRQGGAMPQVTVAAAALPLLRLEGPSLRLESLLPQVPLSAPHVPPAPGAGPERTP